MFDTNNSQQKRWFDSYGFQMSARLPKGAMLFGGFSYDRLQENTCGESDNPNLLRFCNDSNPEGNLPAGDAKHGYNIPFLKNGKLSGSMPMKWGITVSGAFQSNMGYPNRSLTHDEDDRRHLWVHQQHDDLPDGERPAVLPGLPERRRAVGRESARDSRNRARHRSVHEPDGPPHPV